MTGKNVSRLNQNELISEISKLNIKKSGGHDNVSPKLLKENTDIFIKPLVHLINLSLQTGIVPDKLKIAKVIPIYKKDERFYVNNYRPISLLSTINKLLEKLMYKRLISFLNVHKILYSYQFGFRENYSTTLALIEITDNILHDLENGKFVCGIYLDLSKAFDTVDHNILLSKLHHYGIRGQPLLWFKSYLSNRKQYTVCNGKKSSLQVVTHGVPQGSVLGPLLFLLYTNDIIKCIDIECKLRLFADDSNVFVSRNTAGELKLAIRDILRKLFDWFAANKLTVNLDKTCYTIFKTKNRVIPAILNNISFDNITIAKVENKNYLGVYLDENLNWQKHIKELETTLIKISNSFKIIKHKIPNENKLLLYYAYIYSKIQYGIEVFGSASNTVLQQIQTKQNRALKILFDKDYFTPTNELHKDLGVLLVSDIYKLYLVKFIYKHQHNMLPEVFDNYFVTNDTIHRYHTRQNNKLHISHCKNMCGKKMVKTKGIQFWNELPEIIRYSNSIKSFTNGVKHYLLKYY